jgi:hypothetical protein
VFLCLSVLDVVSGVLYVSDVLYCTVVLVGPASQTRLGIEGVFNLYYLIYCERARVIHVERNFKIIQQNPSRINHHMLGERGKQIKSCVGYRAADGLARLREKGGWRREDKLQ